jgi:hypothetical protein
MPPADPPGTPPAPSPVRSNYLALPSRDLGFLRNTLRLYLREEKVAEVMLAFGARCGAAQVLQSQVEVGGPDELAELLPIISAQIGLAKIKPQVREEGRLVLELTRLAEAPPSSPSGGKYEFTRGFLEGVVTQLLGGRAVARALSSPQGSPGTLVEIRWSLGVPAPPPAPLPTALAPPTTPKGRGGALRKEPSAGAYLLEERPGIDPLEVFVRHASRHGGLAITVDRGREIRARKELSRVTVYDLVQRESTGLLTQEAGNLPALLSTVDEFLKRNPGGVVLLGDLPVLLSANGIEPTRNFLSIVAEMLSESKGLLLAVAPTGALPAGERSLLQRVLKVYTSDA